MEKHKAHYSLAEIKELIQKGNYNFTMSSRTTIHNELNLTESEALDIILKLQARDLYKSMTVYHDHRLWQDVYKPLIKNVKLYIKLQLLEKLTIVISFKKAEE